MIVPKREDVFRLPPLTEAEAKVVNTIIHLNLLPDHECTPELLRKVGVLKEQVEVGIDFLGKTVVSVDPGDPVRGTVVRVLTAEEHYERDWEDTDDFDESTRGTMVLDVNWHTEDGDELDRAYTPDLLKVVE